jgi:hypothetical protein
VGEQGVGELHQAALAAAVPEAAGAEMALAKGAGTFQKDGHANLRSKPERSPPPLDATGQAEDAVNCEG